MEKDFSKHHIVAKSQNGSNYQKNLVKLVHSVHVALHTVFENRTPVEQIERLLSINSTALTRDFKHDISRVLLTAKADEDYVYERGILKPRNYK